MVANVWVISSNFHNECHYISMLVLKLIHISGMGHWCLIGFEHGHVLHRDITDSVIVLVTNRHEAITKTKVDTCIGHSEINIFEITTHVSKKMQ